MASTEPLRMLLAVDFDAGHAGLGGEGNELGVEVRELAAAETVLLLGEDDDGAAFGGLVG